MTPDWLGYMSILATIPTRGVIGGICCEIHLLGQKMARHATSVLVIEDDPAMLRFIRRTLELDGFAVISATDGPSALNLFQIENADLVLLDIGLPEIDGLDVCHRLKATRPVYFEASGGFTDTPVYERGKLLPADTWEGPAVIEEPDSTIIVPPGYRATVDRYLSVIIEASP